jgi:hypothetical protein
VIRNTRRSATGERAAHRFCVAWRINPRQTEGNRCGSLTATLGAR